MKLGLAGDTMLGRKVAAAIAESGPESLVAEDVVAVAREADLLLLNLESCISGRGERWPDPGKPFFFRAPPEATGTLCRLGVSCVTLANNHALDFGAEALLDTFEHLRAAGIDWVGAGADRERARAPVVLESDGLRLAVLGCSDHPAAYAAGAHSPGIAYGLEWLPQAIRRAHADVVLVTPHWGPNMAPEPLPSIRRSAEILRGAGAALVVGHSAHVFHGVEEGVLYDLGDFLDDYAVDGQLRNDLGLFFLVDLDHEGPARLEAVPLKLEYCHTRLAAGPDAEWIGRRFREACRAFGTEVGEERGRLVVTWRP
jgi:poly-gamma-glutamate capsule biosynthesis protein CapA/YwtB (metallophosphatase superfamily)